LSNIVICDGIKPESFASLRSECGMEALNRNAVELALKNSLFGLSAIEEARTVGMARVVGDGVFAFILYDLLVDPAYRQRGIGTMLVNEIMEKTLRYVAEGEWVTLGLFCTQGRETFYSRFGFKEMTGNRFGIGMQKIYK